MPWWALPVVLAGAAGGLLAIRLAHQRHAERPLAVGLSILGTHGLRERLAGLTVTTVALTLARIGVLLAGCRLARDPQHVIFVYLAVSVLGLLPIGPASNRAATLVAAGAPSVGAATAAGVAIAATSIAAVVVYVLIAGRRAQGAVLSAALRASGGSAATLDASHAGSEDQPGARRPGPRLGDPSALRVVNVRFTTSYGGGLNRTFTCTCPGVT